MKKNLLTEQSLNFAVRIVNVYKYMTREHKEYTLSKQLLRAGTSSGANVAEAQKAQSKADFYSKMSIALKETNETIYWLTLLYRTEYLDDTQYTSLHADAEELLRLLTAICKTVAASK